MGVLLLTKWIGWSWEECTAAEDCWGVEGIACVVVVVVVVVGGDEDD